MRANTLRSYAGQAALPGGTYNTHPPTPSPLHHEPLLTLQPRKIRHPNRIPLRHRPPRSQRRNRPPHHRLQTPPRLPRRTPLRTARQPRKNRTRRPTMRRFPLPIVSQCDISILSSGPPRRRRENDPAPRSQRSRRRVHSTLPQLPALVVGIERARAV